MTIKQELIDYAKDCLSGKIKSCVAHRWACQRFLDDIAKSESKNIQAEPFPYHWDEDEANRIVEWFSYLKHHKGKLAGQFINLTTQQRFFICQLYGWRQDITEYKRFTHTFLELARKNAKSQVEAGIALYEIAYESTRWGEIYEAYCAGTKREQSKIVFDEANNMLKGSPLRKKFKITRNAIVHMKTGSFLKALSKDDGQNGDGTNPAVLILDEYHQHKTTEFYDLGLGGNTKQSLLMIITTAGRDLNCPCYQQEYSYVKKLLNPDVTSVRNDSYLADVFELDEGDDFKEPSNWAKANPIRMTYSEGAEKIRKAYEKALIVPEEMTAFLTKMLNVWVQAKNNGYMDMAKWKACIVEECPIDTRGMSVYVGFDMSAKIDLTSVTFIIPVQLGLTVKYIVYSHSFIPNREKLMERTLKDKVPYDAWERNGYITVTNTPIVDQSAVMNYVLDVVKKNEWHIECLCFDPANASKMMMELADNYDVEEVYQSAKSLNEATAGFREQVYDGNVIVLVNPVLNFAMANAVVKSNNGMIKVDKDAVKEKIDPVDATLCAFKLAYYHDFKDSDDIALSWLDT